MNTAYILLGTNLGNKTENIQAAFKEISSRCGTIVRSSGLYETSPWGITEQSFFLNCVVQLDTSYAPEKLLELLLEIEQQMGRVRDIRWGERLIDLDILYFNNAIISSETLTLPHPELHNRRFTLVPLCEVAEHFIHPILHKTSRQLLENCSDDGIVTKTTTSL